MAWRRRDRSGDRIEALVKLGFALLLLLALGIGGLQNFAPVLLGLLKLVGIVLAGVAVLGLIAFLLFRHYRSPTTAFMERSVNTANAESIQNRVSPVRPPVTTYESTIPIAWTVASIRQALGEIDWYQFEKFCAALLQADGFVIERKGGAQPDGGVDLIVEKSGTRALIQCKHWRTWQVQERVIREMLGSMSHFGVRQGAVYTLKGWTVPAAQFAALHDITLVNGDELAQGAALQFSLAKLDELLRPREHHCPKCESIMVERSGAFGSFWGCSRFPSCRGKVKHAGAR